MAVSLGATAVGFIFWPGSPRRIAHGRCGRDFGGAAGRRVEGRRVRGCAGGRHSACDRGGASDRGAAAWQRDAGVRGGTGRTRVIKAMALEQVDETGSARRVARAYRYCSTPTIRYGKAARAARSTGSARRTSRREHGTSSWPAVCGPITWRKRSPGSGRTASTCPRASRSSPGVKDHDKLRSLFEALRSIDVGRGFSPGIGRT